MEKIRLVDGDYDGLTLQGEFSGSRLYVNGDLYTWTKQLDQNNCRVFKSARIVAFDAGWEDDGGR